MLLLESQHKLINLECELTDHQNCTYTIDKYKQETEKLKQECVKHLDTIQTLTNDMAHLKSQMSLTKDKESLLIEMKSDLETELHSSKTYVTEVRLKLSEVTELEEKCRSMEKKMEELVEDNNRKYIEIVDLIENREKLQRLLDEKTSLLSKMEDLNAVYTEVEKEKKKIEERLQLVEKQRADADNLLQHYKNVEKEMDMLKNKLKTTLKAHQEIQEAFQTISIENCNITQGIVALENCVKTLSLSNKELEVEKDSLAEKYSTLKEEVSVKEKDYAVKLQKYEKALNEAQKNYEDLKTTSERTEEFDLELNAKVEELERELQNMTEKLEDNNKTIEGLELSVRASKTDMQQEIKEKNMENERLQQQIKKLETLNANLLNGIEIYENDVSMKIAELAKLKELTEVQQVRMKEYEKSFEVRDALLSELRAENDQQKLSITTLKNEVQYYNENIKMIKNVNNELQMNIREKTTDCEEVNKKYVEIKRVNNNLCDELIKVREENKSLKDTTNQILKEKQNLLQQREDMENERKKMDLASEMLRKENKFLTTCKMELEDRLSKLLLEKKDWIRQKNSDAELLETLHDKLFSAKVAIEDLEYKKEHEAEFVSAKKLEQQLSKMKEDFNRQCSTIEYLMQERQSLLDEKSKWNEAKEELTKKITSSMVEKSETNSEASFDICNSCRSLNEEVDDVRTKVGEEKKVRQKGGFARMQIKLEKLQCTVETLEKQLENEKKKNSSLHVSSTTNIDFPLSKQKTEIASMRCKLHESNMKLASLLEEVESINSQMDGDSVTR